MSNFTVKELEYMHSQRLGRLATIGEDGPHVVPVVFSYNPKYDSIDIHGSNFIKSRKYKDILKDGRVSFVIDDVLPPWNARGVEIRGVAEPIATETGDGIKEAFIRIRAKKIIGWGIDTHSYTQNSRVVSTP